MSDLDNLLDATLDDLADLPSFSNYPAGSHKVLASFGTKEINGKSAVTLDFKYLELVELADENDATPNAGDGCGTMFMLDNEFGQGNLKKCAVPFATALELSSIRDVVEQVQDVECYITTSLRQDKNDKEKFYLQVKEIVIS